MERFAEIPKTSHDFVNKKCSVCGEKQPAEATLTFDNTQKRTTLTTSKQVWEENGITLTNDKASSTTNVADYSAPARFYKNSTITIEYPQMVKIEFNSPTGEYFTALQSSIGSTTQASGNVITVEFAEPTDSYTITLSGGQARLNSLKVFYTAPSFDGASVTLGEDITLNYYATIAESLEAKTTVVFDYNNKTVEAKGEKQSDGRYKYSVELAPQYMTVNVNAKLYFDGKLADEIAEYSIATYAYNKLNNANSSTELKQLLIDMLYYGAAAQKYVATKAGTTVAENDLATSNVEQFGTASNATPETTDFTLVTNKADSYPAYFTGAGVYFDNVNSIYVKLNTTENVTLTVNGEEVDVEDTIVYTAGIKATGFAETYTFVLSCNGVEMQTLTYSVNAYAYAMKDNANMANLALALYRYGMSATAYNA